MQSEKTVEQLSIALDVQGAQRIKDGITFAMSTVGLRRAPSSVIVRRALMLLEAHNAKLGKLGEEQRRREMQFERAVYDRCKLGG